MRKGWHRIEGRTRKRPWEKKEEACGDSKKGKSIKVCKKKRIAKSRNG